MFPYSERPGIFAQTSKGKGEAGTIPFLDFCPSAPPRGGSVDLSLGGSTLLFLPVLPPLRPPLLSFLFFPMCEINEFQASVLNPGLSVPQVPLPLAHSATSGTWPSESLSLVPSSPDPITLVPVPATPQSPLSYATGRSRRHAPYLVSLYFTRSPHVSCMSYIPRTMPRCGDATAESKTMASCP